MKKVIFSVSLGLIIGLFLILGQVSSAQTSLTDSGTLTTDIVSSPAANDTTSVISPQTMTTESPTTSVSPNQTTDTTSSSASSGTSASTLSPTTQTMTLCQTVEALILAGGIAPDKIAAAKAAADCPATATAIQVNPQDQTIYTGEKITFEALSEGSALSDITWIAAEEGGGIIDDQGIYTAPQMAGIFHIIANGIDTTLQPGMATITVRLKPIQTTTTSSSGIVPVSQTSIGVNNAINTFITNINAGLTGTAASSSVVKTQNTPIPISVTAAEIQSTANTFEVIQSTVASSEQAEVFKSQGGDLLYKDSNNDGISDYDSVYVYSLDPIKPSPTTVYEGKSINAGEKVLLGLDPTQSTSIKINPEEPKISSASTTTAYKVEEVKLTSAKGITITGRALPNSFVTIYIYSTPIIVTVKTDANGEWQYTLDKELDNGQHTIYTATVNNTGKILAKSSAFTFIKTAEAAALESLPPVPVSTDNVKPGIFGGKNIFIVTGLLVAMIFLALIITGTGNRKNTQS